MGMSEDQLPSQGLTPTVNSTRVGPGADVNRLTGTVVNGGKAVDGEGWAQTLQRELANRYIASALCSWYVVMILLRFGISFILIYIGMQLEGNFREYSLDFRPTNSTSLRA